MYLYYEIRNAFDRLNIDRQQKHDENLLFHHCNNSNPQQEENI